MLRFGRRLAATVVVALFIASTGIAYADEGIATWYGPGFHGRRMANGQVFDMYDPTTTAANIFPMGTWLKVTNIANERSVTVQVRDRGGFQHALDLSYAAFAQLDDPKKMQIKVRYEVVPAPSGVQEQHGDAISARGGQRPADSGTPPAAPSVPSPPSPAPSVPPKPATATTGSGVGDQYVVQPGDTLNGIAAKFNMNPKALASLNAIDNPDRIAPGQKLRVAAPQAGQSAGTSSKPVPTTTLPSEYLVQEGDTLDGIARRFGLSPENLAGLNGIENPDLLAIGRRLILQRGQAVPKATKSAGSNPTTYTVAPGETLSEIAERYGISQKTLMDLNDLVDADRIVAGQEIRVPSSSGAQGKVSGASAKEYIVRDGDTLGTIADRLGLASSTLASLNGIQDPNLIQPGQVLRLP